MYVKRQKGEHTTLTEEKIAKLESIGFKFNRRTSEDGTNEDESEGDATGEDADTPAGKDATEANAGGLSGEDAAEQQTVGDIIPSGDALIADAGSLPALPNADDATVEDTTGVKVENNAAEDAAGGDSTDANNEVENTTAV